MQDNEFVWFFFFFSKPRQSQKHQKAFNVGLLKDIL